MARRISIPVLSLVAATYAVATGAQAAQPKVHGDTCADRRLAAEQLKLAWTETQGATASAEDQTRLRAVEGFDVAAVSTLVALPDPLRNGYLLFVPLPDEIVVAHLTPTLLVDRSDRYASLNGFRIVSRAPVNVAMRSTTSGSAEQWNLAVNHGEIVRRPVAASPGTGWRTYEGATGGSVAARYADTCESHWLTWQALRQSSELAQCAAADDTDCTGLASALTGAPNAFDLALLPFSRPATNGYLFIVHQLWETEFVHLAPDLHPIDWQTVPGKGGFRVVSRQPLVIETVNHPGTGLFTVTAWLATADQSKMRLTRLASRGEHDDRPVTRQLSPDGRSVVFVRDDDLWLASTEDGTERKLLAERPNEEPDQNLTRFEDPQFSPDGRTVFFFTEAWATSGAVHALDIRTLTQRFVVDSNGLMLIPRGPHAGRLFVQRHKYKTFPEGVHSYEWCGVVDLRGQTIQTLSTDLTLCPDDSPKEREKIERALGIGPSAAGRR